MAHMGCRTTCTELMAAAMDAVQLHSHVTGRISQAVMDGDDDALADLTETSTRSHNEKVRALAAYRHHLANHPPLIQHDG
jgi:uncharacterized protein YciW